VRVTQDNEQRILAQRWARIHGSSGSTQYPQFTRQISAANPIQIFNTSNPDEKSDNDFDVAVVPLGEEIAKQFDVADFLSIEDVDPNEIA
jgi:hypothetical protein